ncbi:general APC amino acid permease [Mycena rosella]|uniref:General APC amino acid permease n=1 Tax=Mycena rosella TaxID=1033263 RepID=A0AAD7H055_MYCRO|nr:general APC amino acid permease [Mycena rosella]
MDKKWRASKSSQEIVETVASEDRYDFDFHDLDRVQRRLKQRHVQMCIAGTIGTGLFLGSGNALRVAGPLGALIAYTLVGTVAYSSLCCIGEMTTWAPITGTFPHYASRWVDPAFGFAVGWNYFCANATSVPVEISAAVILMTFWDKDASFHRLFSRTMTSHAAIYTAVIAILICAINIFGVRFFGESEFFFSVIKLILIIVILFAGLVIDLGGGPDHERIGFKYWVNPGPVNRAHLVEDGNTDRFLAILSVVIQAAFSFQGMEMVCIAASETENPRRNIAKAVRRVFYRIVVFYMLGILMIGMLVAYDNPDLLSKVGTAAQSPFVIAMNTFPHLVNAGIFTSAFSAGSSSLFSSSRVLYGLSIRGQAPKFLAYTTKSGLPIASVLATSAFALMSFMAVSAGAETVFNWFVNVTTTGGFIGWFSINLTYVCFHRGMKAQGFDLTKNVYNNPLQPYLAYWGMGWSLIFILMNGYAVFFKFETSVFLTAYINIPIFAAMYFAYKYVYRTKIWKPLEMDFVTGIPTVEETELPADPPVTFLEKVSAVLF